MLMQERAKSARPTPIQEMGLLVADLLVIQVCFLIAVILFHNLRSIRGDFADTLGYFLWIAQRCCERVLVGADLSFAICT